MQLIRKVFLISFMVTLFASCSQHKVGYGSEATVTYDVTVIEYVHRSRTKIWRDTITVPAGPYQVHHTQDGCVQIIFNNQFRKTYKADFFGAEILR